MRLKDKVAVITGGSRGLGKATADLFSAEGAVAIILDINDALGEEAANDIVSKGGKAKYYNADVSSMESIEKVGAQIFKEFGKVDVLVNNAGITADSSLKKMTPEQFDRVIAVNLRGPFNCTKVFGLHMAANKSGSIVNTSSIVAHFGNFGQTNYVASKSGLIGMTKTWAKELGPKGVRVNAVAPGFSETEMIQSVPQEILEKLKAQIPLKRFATPRDIANAYLFLASDDSSYINSAVINVDGGHVLQ